MTAPAEVVVDLSKAVPLDSSPSVDIDLSQAVPLEEVSVDISRAEPITGFGGKAFAEIKAGFKRFGQNVGEGVLQANAGMADALRGISKVTAPVTTLGIPAFEKNLALGQDFLKGAATDSRGLAADVGIPEDQKGVADVVVSRASQMAAQLPEFALANIAGPIAGFGALGGLEATGQDATPLEIAQATGQGATTGAIFKAAAPMGRGQRMITQAGGLGGLAALQGGDTKHVAEAATTGLVLGSMGPKQGLRFRDLMPKKATPVSAEPAAIPETPAMPEAPITPLEVKTAPLVTGGGEATGRVVENRIAFRPDKINAPEDIASLIQTEAKTADQFKAQRISKSDADIQALAKDVGLTPDQLIKARPGSIANAETVFKSRQIVNDLAVDLQQTIRGIDTATATPEQLQVVKEKTLRLQGAMKAVAGFRTEASHIFRQFKIKSAPGETEVIRDLVGGLKGIDGEAAGNLSDFIGGTRKLMEPSLADKGWHLWYASILSGPSTHAKNFVGNMAQMVTEVGREVVTRPAEAPTAIRGLFSGLVQGAAEGKRILKEGQPNKFEEQGLKPIVFTGKARILNVADYVGRALAAADAFFKEGFRGMETATLARGQAIAEGLTGKARGARVKELRQTPTPEIAREAEAFAQRGTYNQKPEGVIGAIAEGISSASKKAPVIKFVVPFTRVVANVVNNALDWTPAGVMRAGVGKFKGSMTGRQAYSELGRGVLGTVAMTWFSHLAENGQLTGNGPSNTDRRRQLMAAGWRPNSIRVGDRFYPFSQLGPLAVPMAIVANASDAWRYGELDKKEVIDRATAAVLGTANTILDMSFLSGVASLTTAVNNWDRGGSKWLANFIAQQATAPVPNLYKQVMRYFDATQYDAQTVREKVQSSLRISSGLKPSIDVFGDPIKGDPVTQMTPTRLTADPVKRYLAENDIWISMPAKTTEVRDATTGEKRAMTREEFYTYVDKSGKQIKDTLVGMLPTLESIPDAEQRQDLVNKIVEKIRGGIKKQIGGEAGGLADDVNDVEAFQ